MSHIVRLNMSELRTGMILQGHGFRLLLDGPEIHREKDVYAFNALILNRDDVPDHHVPRGWTTCEFYPSRGLPAEPKGTHRWTVQGNDLAPQWDVELDSISIDQSIEINANTSGC